jgi:hypothetical protein
MTKERMQKTTQQQEFCIRSGGGLQDKDLQFLWVSAAVKKINKDRYTLIARQIETYLKERNTHEL